MINAEVIKIDPRSHLEVADKYHRYAKNLRAYFREYAKLTDCTDIQNDTSYRFSRYQPFFDWLDNNNDDPDKVLPELEDIPRSVLDVDRVLYLQEESERRPYEISIQSDGSFLSAMTGEPIDTGPKGWIFVLKNRTLYAGEKQTGTFPRFHHSSFFSGDSVEAAGMFVCVSGRLTQLFPHSGHYRPTELHMCSLLRFLKGQGVDLKTVQVDVQRVMKSNRDKDKEGVKVKKVDSVLFLDGSYIYNFLRAKQRTASTRLFENIINARRAKDSSGSSSSNLAELAATSAAAATMSGDASVCPIAASSSSSSCGTIGMGTAAASDEESVTIKRVNDYSGPETLAQKMGSTGLPRLLALGPPFAGKRSASGARDLNKLLGESPGPTAITSGVTAVTPKSSDDYLLAASSCSPVMASVGDAGEGLASGRRSKSGSIIRSRAPSTDFSGEAEMASGTSGAGLVPIPELTISDSKSSSSSSSSAAATCSSSSSSSSSSSLSTTRVPKSKAAALAAAVPAVYISSNSLAQQSGDGIIDVVQSAAHGMMDDGDDQVVNNDALRMNNHINNDNNKTDNKSEQKLLPEMDAAVEVTVYPPPPTPSPRIYHYAIPSSGIGSTAADGDGDDTCAGEIYEKVLPLQGSHSDSNNNDNNNDNNNLSRTCSDGSTGTGSNTNEVGAVAVASHIADHFDSTAKSLLYPLPPPYPSAAAAAADLRSASTGIVSGSVVDHDHDDDNDITSTGITQPVEGTNLERNSVSAADLTAGLISLARQESVVHSAELSEDEDDFGDEERSEEEEEEEEDEEEEEELTEEDDRRKVATTDRCD